MKSSPGLPPLSQEARGVALVIVLAMLVLLSALLVAFMSTATTERASSYANAGVTAARQIADSTVSLVISQIRDATSTPDEGVAWASQPGAIRTFSGRITGDRRPLPLNDGAYYDLYEAGSKDFTYKLYSADKMKMRTPEYESDLDFGLPGEVQVIENWKRFDPPKNHVDLNEPFLSPRRDLDRADVTVEPHYPIVDPRAAFGPDERPAAVGAGIVHGFDAKLVFDDKLVLPSSAKVPYLPMPVKWLYVLQDGTIGPASRATEQNPIVGRTAFWTDDDSCKLNVNTSSEGTYWDMPSVSTEQDAGRIPGSQANPVISSTALSSLNLAASQPIRGEYQRYPGHPATTSLSPVLGWLWNVTATTPVWSSPSPATQTYRDFKEAIYAISPFLAKGEPTSQGATRNTDAWLDPRRNVGGYYDDTKGTIKLNVLTKHLYPTPDEMLFKPARFTTGGQQPEINDKLTPEALAKVRFFLTANSRAPELNLAGRPRVTLWPVHRDFDFRTQYDDLFVFTSTISKGTNFNDESDDIRYNLLRFDAKDDLRDFQLPQNDKMFKYLQFMTSLPAPSYGGSLMSNWGFASAADGELARDQMLNLIFDYTRSVNLVDTGTASRSLNVFAPYTPQFFVIPPNSPPEDYTRRYRSYDWSGQVTPTKLRGEAAAQFQGLGRFATVTEVALIFHATTNNAQPAMQAVLAMEMSTPMPGFPAIRETYWTEVRAVDSYQKPDAVPSDVMYRLEGDPDYSPMGFSPEPLKNICNVSSHEITDGRGFMPTLGFTASMHFFQEHQGPTNMDPTNPNANRNGTISCAVKQFVNTAGASRNYVRGQTVQIYPYVSNKINTGGKTKFSFKGGKFEIKMYAGESPADPRSKLVQTFHVHFPPNEVINQTVPVIASSPEFRTRFSNPNDMGAGWDCIRGGDIVRSMELTCNGAIVPNPPAGTPSAGDVRLAMARTEVPPDYFGPRDGLARYINQNAPRVHGLTKGHADPVTGHTGPGRLALGQALRGSKPPILPVGVNGVRRADGQPGDWDRGISKHMSGAFGNKVDEGNLRFDYAQTLWRNLPYFRGRAIEETGQTFFSPNRQLSSPVMLGSLPTGSVVPVTNPRAIPRGWQTLLFRPNRESGVGHPGAGGVGRAPDHLLLDLLSIPVVEPYAISEPFSTAGKVNLNYVMAPFSYAKGDGNSRPYIRRDTAVRGLLKSTLVMTVPPNAREGGHTEDPYTTAATTANYRFPIDLDKTIGAMDARLLAKDTQLFRSASEICTVDLYPEMQGARGTPADPGRVTNWTTFWNSTYSLTGDNMRERPYSHIYPRATTKSNVYTVHMRCQAIRKAKRSKVDEFDPELDQIVGDYRGSATIERFIDPNDIALAKYNDQTEKIDPYYRYRVVNTKHFAPR